MKKSDFFPPIQSSETGIREIITGCTYGIHIRILNERLLFSHVVHHRTELDISGVQLCGVVATVLDNTEIFRYTDVLFSVVKEVGGKFVGANTRQRDTRTDTANGNSGDSDYLRRFGPLTERLRPG